MNYLLDTNVCIRYLNGYSPAIKARLESTDPSLLAICSIVKAELLFGVAKSQTPGATLAKLTKFISVFHSYPFDDRCAEEYSVIRADLERRGLPIGSNDMLICGNCYRAWCDCGDGKHSRVRQN